MSALPFYLVPLTHPTWEEALACGKRLGDDALPELRLDLFPDQDPEQLVRDLKGRCLVTCRRASEYGRFEGSEAERQERVRAALEGRPEWLDWEWDLDVPAWLEAHLMRLRLIRSVHVQPGIFDLEDRLRALPRGDAYKWVGHAARLGDNGIVKRALGWASDHRIPLSAFLMGPKGIAGRAMQAAWGGAFTYAAPDDGPAAAPGQLPLSTLRAWRCSRLGHSFGLCGVIGSPVLHSKGPSFHNPRFQRAFKDLLYLPLDAADAEEAVEAMESLGLLGVSITAPLKETLPEALGLQGPLNTLWRRAPGEAWHHANTDAIALEETLRDLPAGPVLLLGSGGVANASRTVLERLRRPVVQVSRRTPMAAEDLGPVVGVIQGTALGMQQGDPLPFPDLLEAALPSLKWAVEWVYKEDTAFAGWARDCGLHLVEGAALFQAQAEAQSRRFIEGCG